MARHAAKDDPDGPTVAANLMRLGFGRLDVARVARLVTESGEGMTRQRLATVLKLPHMLPETVEKIAKGIGVPPSELTRPPRKPRR